MVTRENESISSVVYRTFNEFQEFHSKLRQLFPTVRFYNLSGSSAMRTNTKEVAFQRKIMLQTFLQNLYSLDEEISHSNIVYTFFHNLHRDNVQRNDNVQSSSGRQECQINLTIKFLNQTHQLSVFVGHVKYLSTNGVGGLPDTYVKTYITSDVDKASTKRKTGISKGTLNPTFNEELLYDMSMEFPHVLESKQLEVSIWNSGGLFDNHRLYETFIPLKRLFISKPDRH
ncbi:unnamed protein product, partial [Auanema sp. JU1783]